MRKTLQDVAVYLKEILVPETHEAYAVDPAYAKVATDGRIREGVVAFRAFLSRLYDVVAAQGAAYDNTKKVAHEYENRTTLSVYYPFLHNVGTMLMRMGYDGALTEDAQSLACGNTIFNEKLSTSKNLECLRFLMECGLCIEGIDANDKKQSLSEARIIVVSYPDNPAMLTGMKALAVAEREHGTLVNQDIFLRCDYRVLKKDAPDALSIVRDTIKPLSPDIQAFLLQLHQRYLDKGLACAVEIKGFHTYIKYTYRRKDVWGLNASLNNGYHINVKPVKTDAYADTIKALHPHLREMIEKGYGCGRKREIGRCDGGCRGIPIPLDDSVLAIREDIVTWLDQEVSCLQKK